MIGAKTKDEMRANLAVLDSGPLDADKRARIWAVGDHAYIR
jgi:hypothetical protein